MLAKCANPACTAKFLYLHEGKLFANSLKPDSLKRGPPVDREYMGNSSKTQYYWLCSTCCRAMTVESDGDHGISLIRKAARLKIMLVGIFV